MALDAAAQHVDHRIFPAGAGFDLIDGISVFHRQALVDAAHDLAVGLRYILAGPLAVFPDPSRDISRGIKLRCSRIHKTL